MQKLPTFDNRNNSVYAIFNDQSFSDTLTNVIFSFEQLGPEIQEEYNSGPLYYAAFLTGVL